MSDLTVHKDPTRKVKHAAQDGEVVCEAPDSSLAEVDDETITCPACQKKLDGGELLGPELFSEEFGDDIVDEALDFTDGLHESFVRMVCGDYGREYVGHFAYYWVTDLQPFELKQKTGANLNDLLTISTTYKELFDWD